MTYFVLGWLDIKC